MGRLNYTNRKIEGLKMAEVAAKDLRKRLLTGSAHKSAQRHPSLDVDFSGKDPTDEGFDLFAEAMIECLGEKVVRLEELSFKDCKLTATSLVLLGKIVRLARATLRDLDLSRNEIMVVTEDEMTIWQSFLESFGGCYSLSRINFSGNPLGQKAFEIFSKVYMQSDNLDFMEPSQVASEEKGKAVCSPKDVNTKLGETPGKSKGSRLSTLLSRDKTLEKKEHVDEHAHHTCTRGLRSVPYIVFQNVALTDISALHLSAVVREHLLPGGLLQFVPWTAGSAADQRFDEYNRQNGSCRGIVYLPNSLLSGAGYKALYLADALRDYFNDTFREVIESSSPSTPPPRSRKQSSVKSRISTGVDDSAKRGTLGSLDEDSAERRKAYGDLKTLFKKAKAKIEGDAMKADGLHSVELWGKALKMLVLARVLLLDDKDKVIKEEKPQQEYKETFPSLPPTDPPAPIIPMFDPSHASFSWNFEDMLAAPPITEGSTVTPQRRKPSIPSSSGGGRKASVVRREPAYIIAAQIRTQNPLLFRLPEAIWSSIVAYAVGATEVLSLRQQVSVVRYARDWNTLMNERDYRGKPRYNQWWNVLEKMECLTYENDGVNARIAA